METVVLVFSRVKFLNAIKEHCIKNNWPLPHSTIEIKINQDKYLKDVLLSYPSISKTTRKLSLQKILIEPDWFNLLVNTRYPNYVLPRKFELIQIGKNDNFDLCISFRKFTIRGFITDCFNWIFKPKKSK